MAKPSWWPYCWDAWRKSRWTVGFSSFFFVGGGWFNRKGFPVFFVKRKNNIKFLLPKIQYRFHLGHFLKPQKEWTKKGLYSFDWRFGIGSKVSFVCWWTSGSFQNDTQVDVFKMIQDAFFPSFCAVVILAVVVIFEFWGGVQLSQPAVKVGVEEVYIQLSTFK